MLKESGFGNEFRIWIQILMKNPESCIIKSGKTTPYFKLEIGTREGDPILANLFIIALEVVFSLAKVGLSPFKKIFLFASMIAL